MFAKPLSKFSLRANLAHTSPHNGTGLINRFGEDAGGRDRGSGLKPDQDPRTVCYSVAAYQNIFKNRAHISVKS